MPDWKDEFDRRNAAQMDKAMRPRPRVDQTMTTPATTAEAVADSVDTGTSTGAVPERVAPMAGHPDSRGAPVMADPADWNENVPRNTAEQNLMRQAEADPVYQLHGRRAPAPEPGEHPIAYDTRLIRPLQHHSETWAGVDYAALRGGARNPVRADILKAAAHAADHPKVPEGELREVRRADSSGRIISTFHGSPGVWLGQFKLPKQIARIRDPR